MIHVLTACTRPENLGMLADSLVEAQGNTSLAVHWHIRFDPDKLAIGGQAVKNSLLDEIQDGWVWVLDDDTLVHSGLFAEVERHPEADAVIVSQARPGGGNLTAHPGNMQVGHVDIGQAVLQRHLIGDNRLPLTYDGDGRFLHLLVPRCENVVYVDKILSFHNKLRDTAPLVRQIISGYARDNS